MDGFILRASLGDVDEVTRRLERKQTVNGKHSVRTPCCLVSRLAVCPFSSLDFSPAQRLKYTALHAAADNGHLNVVQVLIAYGADVNAQRTVRAVYTIVCPLRHVSRLLCSSTWTLLFISLLPVDILMSCRFCWRTAPSARCSTGYIHASCALIACFPCSSVLHFRLIVAYESCVPSLGGPSAVGHGTPVPTPRVCGAVGRYVPLLVCI